MRSALNVVLAAWLVVGTMAASQRDVLDHGLTCDAAATTAATAAVGPFNYYGIAPSVRCPEPTP